MDIGAVVLNVYVVREGMLCDRVELCECFEIVVCHSFEVHSDVVLCLLEKVLVLFHMVSLFTHYSRRDTHRRVIMLSLAVLQIPVQFRVRTRRRSETNQLRIYIPEE